MGVKERYQREKVHEDIREKYGIVKKLSPKKNVKSDIAVLYELKVKYGMEDEDARELQNKMNNEAMETQAAKEKVDKKMEVRKKKKKIRENLRMDNCKQQ